MHRPQNPIYIEGEAEASPQSVFIPLAQLSYIKFSIGVVSGDGDGDGEERRCLGR